MPYHRRGSRMGLRPINRIKHVVDASALVAGAAGNVFNIAIATDTPTLGNTTGVETGAKINGFYIRFEVASNEQILGGIPNFYMFVAKNPGGNITLPAANAVGGNDNKRFVVHQEMTMIENVQGGNARTVFNGVIVIPKGMRRMGPNDVWSIQTLCPVLNTAQCIQVHYKEFR